MASCNPWLCFLTRFFGSGFPVPVAGYLALALVSVWVSVPPGRGEGVIAGGSWALSYDSVGFRQFPNILWFPKIRNLATHEATGICQVITAHRFTCGEKKFGKTSKILKIFCNWLQILYFTSAYCSFPYDCACVVSYLFREDYND